MNYPEIDDFDNDLDYLDAMRKFNIWNRDHGHLSDAEIEELRECQKNERAYLKRCHAIATCSNQVAYGIALEQARKEMREWQKSGKRVAKKQGLYLRLRVRRRPHGR